MALNAQVDFKIFIVDDSPVVAERLRQMLNEVDHASVVGAASNITTALCDIKQQQPNVVVLDIHLKDDAPAANGINLLEMLHTKYPDMIIIMLTNLPSERYIKRCLELGANYFLDKSNEFDKIPKILDKIYEYRYTTALNIPKS